MTRKAPPKAPPKRKAPPKHKAPPKAPPKRKAPPKVPPKRKALPKRKAPPKLREVKAPPKRKASPKLREVKAPRRKPPPARAARDAAAAVARIEHAFLAAYARLAGTGYDVRALAHKNRDHTVDGDLTVQIPRGQEPRGVLVDLELALSRVTDVWISVGIRTPPRPHEARSGRLVTRGQGEVMRGGRGTDEAGAYYQRSTPLKWAQNFATGRQIVDNFARVGRRKPEQAYVRIHWNPWDTKPTRD